MPRSSSPTRRGLLVGAGAAAALPWWTVHAQGAQRRLAFDPAFIDSEVERFRYGFDVPGFAVAVVGAGEPWVRGYGVRTLGRPEPLDAHTRFGIASNTKAYTAAAMAILVDEGRLAWDDPVVSRLPEFRMYDPAVTQMMTLRDLLCHRSGLPLGAGDLLVFPDTTHVAADVLKALPYLKPERPFRSGYAYDNILYTVAGLVIERVTGTPLRDFLRTRLLEPIGEADAVAELDLLRTDNFAGRHGRRGGLVLGEEDMTVVQPQGEHGDTIVAAASTPARQTRRNGYRRSLRWASLPAASGSGARRGPRTCGRHK